MSGAPVWEDRWKKLSGSGDTTGDGGLTAWSDLILPPLATSSEQGAQGAADQIAAYL
jgi:hypothetical protein